MNFTGSSVVLVRVQEVVVEVVTVVVEVVVPVLTSEWQCMW